MVHKMKKTTENTLRYYIRNEIGIEERNKIINFMSKDDREDFKRWINGG